MMFKFLVTIAFILTVILALHTSDTYTDCGVVKYKVIAASSTGKYSTHVSTGTKNRILSKKKHVEKEIVKPLSKLVKDTKFLRIVNFNK